jgi:hypothetical protein
MRQMYKLKISLLHIEPEIWRRVVVPRHIHLGQLHDVIQCVMGWTDTHLHEFSQGNRHFGDPDFDFDEPSRLTKESNAKLHKLLSAPGDRLDYAYDMGDYWEHAIVLEQVLPTDTDKPITSCLGGERGCPPEDVGGPWSYAEFLEAIGDPDHEEHDHLVAWAGEYFNAEEFDLSGTNVRLTNLTYRWRWPRESANG